MLSFNVVTPRPLSPACARLSSLCEAVLPGLSAHTEWSRLITSPPELVLMLGTDAESRAWGVSKLAIGFFAIARRRRFDGDGIARQSFASDLRVVVNLEAGLREIGREWTEFDQGEREAVAESLATTVAHEALHTLSWAAASGGRPPAAVYAEGGERLVQQTMERANAAIDTLYPGGRGTTTEDRIEAVARWITKEALPPEFPALVAALGSDWKAHPAPALDAPKRLTL